MSRIGSPFVSVCYDTAPENTYLDEIYTVLQYLSIQYEKYPTPYKTVRDDYEAVHHDIKERVKSLVAHYFPALKNNCQLLHNTQCQATTRTQDYCAIKTFFPGIVDRPVHLDIDVGLGTHAFYIAFFI